MTKQELAQKVSADTGLSGSDAKSAVDATFDAIAGELANGGEVAVEGFGKFSVSARSAREGRNPATGETIQIAASNAAKFSAAVALKKSLGVTTGGRRSEPVGEPSPAGSASGEPGPPDQTRAAVSPKRVFVSFSHEDESEARQLKHAFARHGVLAWLASDDVLAGENVSERVADNLRTASVLVLLIGPRPSRWARHEWSQALEVSWERGVPLLPVVLEGAQVPHFLQDQPFLEVSGAPAGWDEVARKLALARTSERRAPPAAQDLLAASLEEIEKAAAALPGPADEQT